VELAFSSFSRLRRRMAEQRPEGIIATAEYLTEGTVIWQVGADDRIRQLQDKARAAYNGRPDAISANDLAWRCYDIWNRVKDLEDSLDDPVSGYYLAYLPYWSLVTLYFRLARFWLPRPKVVFSTIKERDATLYDMCARFTDAGSNAGRHGVLREMMDYLEGKFGIVFERYYRTPPPEG
jgi:hypothetical protein